MDRDSLATLDRHRMRMRRHTLDDEPQLVRRLVDYAALEPATRRQVTATAVALVKAVRAEGGLPLMERFLAEYGLSTTEGVGLMCLAEALLRVPDEQTIDDLIRDKIEPSDWGAHLGRSSSSLVNASSWALLLTGRLLDEKTEASPVGALRAVVRRLGEPVVRVAVAAAMKALGQQFVLGQTIEEALRRGKAMREQGFTYSYDMLGEAARTAADAARYQQSYEQALHALRRESGPDLHANPGISVKLSALHPRFEYVQRERLLAELVPRVLQLAQLARAGNLGFSIDAEEADRLDISLDVVQAVLADPALAGWDGFGVVVQAYGKRAGDVLDWLHALAAALDRRIMVRLVKGAYWDSEIKHAQALGLRDFPVFTRKVHTDVGYLAWARKLLGMADRIYPQFATHNAHTCAAVLALARDRRATFEFQRLHGMGEVLHRLVMGRAGTRCRIYAPVGAHRDLLAYLVRRLLENGANSSFVNQIADPRVAPEEIARDPLEVVENRPITSNPGIPLPPALYRPVRENSRGWNPHDAVDVEAIVRHREAFRHHRWQAAPMLAAAAGPDAASDAAIPVPTAASGARAVRSPADSGDLVGTVVDATPAQVGAAFTVAAAAFPEWSARPAAQRSAILRRAARLYEDHAAELFALCAREAGKTLADAVAELREAVDFLHYYAAEAERLAGASSGAGADTGRGIFACISPWNFPLAIFTGQVAAALAAGNVVLAKPAEQTTLVAARAVALLREAGVPAAALQLLPGAGETIGAQLSGSPALAGVLFTGSTAVAQAINRALAEHAAPDAVLVAETGGINAMIVDSTALPEQAVRDILASAFQSAGQRCSALRMLYVQREVSERLLEMLEGAMAELVLGDPWSVSTDVGPVIDEDARRDIQGYCDRMTARGRLVRRLDRPADGRFVAPHVLKVAGIAEVEREVFGPVLHVATFEAQSLEQVVADINARGFGLTFGLHTRIDDRVQRVVDRIRAGNIYVNRNQIGAVVGSQPFGGEGLSGTGPKAGGPGYLPRLMRTVDAQRCGEPARPRAPAAPLVVPQAAGAQAVAPKVAADSTAVAVVAALQGLEAADWAMRDDRLAVLRRTIGGRLDPGFADALFAALAGLPPEPVALPGPTGESNQLRYLPRGPALCLGPGAQLAFVQAIQALAAGAGAVVVVEPEAVASMGFEFDRWRAQGLPLACLDTRTLPEDPAWLGTLQGFGVLAWAGAGERARALRRVLARREGEIKPLVTEAIAPARYRLERLICVDTTAAGGNASLLAASDGVAAGAVGMLSVGAGGM